MREDSLCPWVRDRQGTDNMDVVAPASIHGGIGAGVPDWHEPKDRG